MNLLDLAAHRAGADKILGVGGYLKGFVPMLAGLALVLVGVGFKLALVPFHLWTPDVYQGAPAPVTAFVATASKGAVFALLLRLGGLMDLQSNAALHLALFVVAIASMLGGNLLALWQNNVKRVLAYSSIAHMGYLLVALLAGQQQATATVAFYLAAYFVTMIGAFGVVSVLARDGGEEQSLADYRGLFFRRPAVAAIFAAMLLSLAGLPLTAGFLGKFLVLRAGMAGGQWALVGVLIASSGIGLFYYLRIALAMFDGRGKKTGGPAHALPAAGTAVLWTMTFLLLALGIFPEPLLRLIDCVVLSK